MGGGAKGAFFFFAPSRGPAGLVLKPPTAAAHARHALSVCVCARAAPFASERQQKPRAAQTQHTIQPEPNQTTPNLKNRTIVINNINKPKQRRPPSRATTSAARRSTGRAAPPRATCSSTSRWARRSCGCRSRLPPSGAPCSSSTSSRTGGCRCRTRSPRTVRPRPLLSFGALARLACFCVWRAVLFWRLLLCLPLPRRALLLHRALTL